MDIMLKKKEIFKNLFKNTNLIICPICNENLFIDNDSLKCKNNHTFNINKKGYISLLKKQKKFESDIYTYELFENRRETILSGLYDCIHEEIANFINKNKNKYINIFEIGSGESTHSYLIKKKIITSNTYVVSDISKEAIELSTDYISKDIIPIVCDAYNLPISNDSIDYIIDILSPYYYKEINRTLKNDGYIIKVFPEKKYLNELRQLVDLEEYKKEEEVYANFCKYFNVVESKIVNYCCNISSDLAINIFKMTPMTNNHKINKKLNKITINLKIVFAKKKQ